MLTELPHATILTLFSLHLLSETPLYLLRYFSSKFSLKYVPSGCNTFVYVDLTFGQSPLHPCFLDLCIDVFFLFYYLGVIYCFEHTLCNSRCNSRSQLDSLFNNLFAYSIRRNLGHKEDKINTTNVKFTMRVLNQVSNNVTT